MDITIPVNRKRAPLAFLVLMAGTVFFSYGLLSDDNGSLSGRIVNAIFLLPAIAFLLCFAILTLIDYLRVLFGKNTSLKISATGISDDLSIFSCGAIPWSDITGAEIFTSRVGKVEFLLLHLADNHKYVSRKRFLVRHALKRFIQKWNTPAVISSRRVNYNLNELRELIVQRIQP